jgi:purine-binding chemotaxis protein CheW
MDENTSITKEEEVLSVIGEEAESIAEEDENQDLQRCLVFASGDLTLFLSTEYVNEIINDHTITPIPTLPDYVKGVINLRGQILPVIDIRLMMNGSAACNYTSKTCIIVLNIDSTPIGIIVDTVHSVMDIDRSQIHPLPLKKQQKLANGMIRLENGTVAMSFDAEALVHS